MNISGRTRVILVDDHAVLLAMTDEYGRVIGIDIGDGIRAFRQLRYILGTTAQEQRWR